MTPDEIQKKVDALMREARMWSSMNQLINYDRAIFELCCELVSKAYEMSAQQSCKFCRNNVPVKQYAGGDWYHPEAWRVYSMQGAEVHRTDAECDASGIRNLAALLVTEPVSS